MLKIEVDPTQEQRDDIDFEDSDLELTESAALLFAKNMDAHNKESKATCKMEVERYREIDDQRTTQPSLLHSNSRHQRNSELNTLYPAFQALASDCICRSATYLDIMTNQFSKGNSKSNINEITKFLSLSQDNGETEAAWTYRLVEHFNRIEPVLSPAPLSLHSPSHASLHGVD